MVSQLKALDAFKKFYSPIVSTSEADGNTTTGFDNCLAYEEEFFATVVEFRTMKLLSSVACKSNLPEYNFMVVATCFNDFTTDQYTMTGNQTSICYWSDDKFQKVYFQTPSEIIA